MERADCSVRAISAALNIPYEEAYSALAMAGRKQSRRTPTRFSRKVLQGQARLVTLRKGCTVERFIREHTAGRFVVRVRGHMFAVIDGTAVDNRQTPPRSIVKSYWKVGG